MIELIGKIITARCPDRVFVFRLTQQHIDLDVLQDHRIIVNEATSLEKKLWFQAFELMEATSSADMGLEFTYKQYNKIKSLCMQQTE